MKYLILNVFHIQISILFMTVSCPLTNQIVIETKLMDNIAEDDNKDTLINERGIKPAGN